MAKHTDLYGSYTVSMAIHTATTHVSFPWRHIPLQRMYRLHGDIYRYIACIVSGAKHTDLYGSGIVSMAIYYHIYRYSACIASRAKHTDRCSSGIVSMSIHTVTVHVSFPRRNIPTVTAHVSFPWQNIPLPCNYHPMAISTIKERVRAASCAGHGTC